MKSHTIKDILQNKDVFKNIQIKNIILKKINGGMSNNIYKLLVNYNNYTYDYVVKIHKKSEELIDRKNEKNIIQHLSKIKLTPKIILYFENGYIEKFINAKNITFSKLTRTCIIKKLVYKIQKIHKQAIKNLKHTPILLDVINKFYKIASDRYDKNNLVYTKIFNKSEYIYFNNLINNITGEIVFCHNDLQLNNIMKSEKKIHIIDYEYAGYNFLFYDLVNHFIEIRYKYSDKYKYGFKYTENPLKYKTYLQQFLNIYFDNNNHVIKKFKKEFVKFELLSNLLWGLWGLCKKNKNIQFNYQKYSEFRLKKYLLLKKKI